MSRQKNKGGLPIRELTVGPKRGVENLYSRQNSEKRPVVLVSLDEGFGQYMGETLTAVKDGMNITHILLTNNERGKISKEPKGGN